LRQQEGGVVPPVRLERLEVSVVTRLEPDRQQQQQKSPLNQSFGSARSVPQLDETDGHQSFLNPSGIKVRRQREIIEFFFDIF
jgi:hypothetical protein